MGDTHEDVDSAAMAPDSSAMDPEEAEGSAFKDDVSETQMTSRPASAAASANGGNSDSKPSTPRLLAPIPNISVSLQIAIRKTHSATVSTNSPSDDITQSLRPYTAAGIEDLPSGKAAGKSPKKKLHPARRATMDVQTSQQAVREDRPRSAGLNGWGDFNTDRLLADNSAELESAANPESMGNVPGSQRARSRKSRRSTPTTTSPRSGLWERDPFSTTGEPGTLKPGRDLQRPIQTLRQRHLDTLDGETDLLARDSTQKTHKTPNLLVGRGPARVQSSRSRPASSCSSRPSTPAPLFGPDIHDTPETRATIFRRVGRLWTLMSRRSCSGSTLGQPTDGAASVSVTSPSSSSIAPRRSPFECSMAMLKVCKTVGILLTSSSSAHLSFWYSQEQGVTLEAFCELLVRHAIQPAFHHFHMDASVAEYMSTLDIVVQSLVASQSASASNPEGPERLREVAEIEPVFPHWRTGISPQVVTSEAQPATSMDTSGVPVPVESKRMTAQSVRQAVAASVSQRLLALQLGSEEARVTQEENIRRKVQLHKSWRLGGGKNRSMRHQSASSPQLQLARANVSEATPLVSDFHPRVSMDRDPRVRHGHPRAVQSSANAQVNEQDTSDADDVLERDEVLVCCLCSERRAVLWCSSCFSVSCQKCWQEVHACTVDMSSVAPPATTAIAKPGQKPPPLGPTALAIKKKRCGSATLTPPVAMIYLPIKASVGGALAKGNPITRHHSAGRRRPNQVSPGSLSASQSEGMGVFAHAILPALHKSRSEDMTLKQRHTRSTLENTTDSTADLVKSLLLRVPPSTPGASTPASATASHSLSSRVSSDASKRTLKETSARPKLSMSSVSLDAELLLLHGPDRER